MRTVKISAGVSYSEHSHSHNGRTVTQENKAGRIFIHTIMPSNNLSGYNEGVLEGVVFIRNFLLSLQVLIKCLFKYST